MITLLIFVVLIILICMIARLSRKREPRKNIEVSPEDCKKMRKFRFIVLLLWLPVVLLLLDVIQFIRWGDTLYTVSRVSIPYDLENWVNRLKHYIPGLHVCGNVILLDDTPETRKERESIVTYAVARQQWRSFFRWYNEEDPCAGIIGGIRKTDFLIVGIISLIVLGPIFKVANGFQKHLIEKRSVEKLKEAAKLKDHNGKPIEGREYRLIKEGLEWAKAPDEIILFAEDIIGDVIISGKTKEDASIKKIYPKKDIGLCLSDLKKEVYGWLVRLMIKYEKEGDIPKNELDTISTEHMPLTNLILKSWFSMDEPTRETELRKYASGAAMAQLSNKAFTLVDKLITIYSNTDKTDLEKGLIKEKAEEVKSRIAVLREMRGVPG